MVPVILSASTSALRFSVGFSEDAAAATSALLSAQLRSEDAIWDAPILEDLSLARASGRSPLQLGILEIPGPGKELVAFLTLKLKASPGTTIHFASLSIDRP